MPKTDDWQREAREAVRKEAWSLSGPSMVVKVASLRYDPAADYGGYITLFKYLWNKTSIQIYKDLGLNKEDEDYYKKGARIFRFTRLPQVSEYEYDLTATFPGGLAGRAGDDYPPGSDKIHQWKISRGARIPVDPKFITLGPTDKFPTVWAPK